MARDTGPSTATRLALRARAGGLCERCGERPDEQTHHRRPRGMGGTRRADTNSLSALVRLCFQCHQWIESNRAQAMEDGWLVPQNQDPAGWHVHRWLSWWLISDRGWERIDGAA